MPERTEVDTAHANAVSPQVRLITHFACTGGTLISRAIQAQPSVTLLSEVDPFSDLPTMTRKSLFSPSDLIFNARTSLHGISDDVIADVFLAGLARLQQRMALIGRVLVIRGHAHSQYCVTPERKRPTLYSVLTHQMSVSALVTVRHPLDSWLALLSHEWRHFEPFTLEEYCVRYLRFLDDHAGLDLLKYEAFVADPDSAMHWIGHTLGLRVNPQWRALLPAVRLSGDSGRSGNRVAARSRRAIPTEVEAAIPASPSYKALCDRLGYEQAP